MRSAKGYRELMRHEMGDRLTFRQMILAKCCDCMGRYVDGKLDCGISECPLYPLSPYGNHPVYKRAASDKSRLQRIKNLEKGRIGGKRRSSLSHPVK